MDPHGDCMLAYEMNGVTVPGDHGYPVRALNPGKENKTGFYPKSGSPKLQLGHCTWNRPGGPFHIDLFLDIHFNMKKYHIDNDDDDPPSRFVIQSSQQVSPDGCRLSANESSARSPPRQTRFRQILRRSRRPNRWLDWIMHSNSGVDSGCFDLTLLEKTLQMAFTH